MMRIANSLRRAVGSRWQGSVVRAVFVAAATCLSTHAFTQKHVQSTSTFMTGTRLLSTMGNDSSSVTILEDTEDNLMGILPSEKGSHNSVKILVPFVSEVSDAVDLFASDKVKELFERTVQAYRESGKSSIWVYVPMSRSSVIETADLFRLGFRFHHATGDTSVLNLWLKDIPSKIPEFATHNVGVGALVINSQNEVLCVRELRKNYMPWKTPTGLSDLGERLEDAAVREVMEETGVPTSFHSIVGFRQTHGMAHGRSDLYFVCRLNPIEETAEDGSAVIPQPVAQQCEIEQAKWVPFDEYKAMVDGTDEKPGHPMMSQVLATFESGIAIEKKTVNSVVPGRKPNSIFHPTSSS